MGAPSGHPFFGNQYTNGGYQSGTYTYVGSGSECVMSTVNSVLKENANNKYSISAQKNSDKGAKELSHIQKSFAINDLSGRDKAIIIGGILVTVVSIGSVITYKKLKKMKKKETVELENIGVCTDCGKPLIDSELHLENDRAFISCNNCGIKNYAHYDE